MQPRLAKWTGIGFLVLLINPGYIAAFASPTIFYMSNVLFHLALGVALSIAVVFLILRNAGLPRHIAPALGFFMLAVLAAIYLVAAGNIPEHRSALWAHIDTATLGTAPLIAYAWNRP